LDHYREPRAAYEQPAQRRADGAGPPANGDAILALPLPWLLARVLLAVAMEFERESAVSLAIAANLLRVLDEQGVRVRDLPARSGVSTESLAMATGCTGKRGLTVIEPDPAGHKWKIARLTETGVQTREACLDLLGSLEYSWHEGFGGGTAALRTALEPVAGSGNSESPLLAGPEPYPDGWRAAVRRQVTLPHFPMVLHRGGYPDGR
jgi:hypothetical protein